MNEEDRLEILFRGRCGAWVLEMPDGEIHDLAAVPATQLYWDYYDMDELYIRDPEPEEGTLCIHGLPITESLSSKYACAMCCEEFLTQQLAMCLLRDGKTLEEVTQYIGGFIDNPIPAPKIVRLVEQVFSTPDGFDPLV